MNKRIITKTLKKKKRENCTCVAANVWRKTEIEKKIQQLESYFYQIITEMCVVHMTWKSAVASCHCTFTTPEIDLARSWLQATSYEVLL